MKIVCVTGANRGLGAAFAEQYLAAGWRVLALVKSRQAEEVVLHQTAGRALVCVADLAEDKSRGIIRDFFIDQDLPIDLLINNAGPPASTTGIEDDALGELVVHFQVHCAGVLRSVQAATPFLLRASAPLVVNISSRLGSISRMASGMYADIHRSLSYPVAKAAQNMLSVQLHRVLYPRGCRVVAVHPGALLTGCGSNDAATPVARGAAVLMRLFRSLGKETSGVYLDPEGETIPW